MGDFDDAIAWCLERRLLALEDITDYTSGARQYRNDVDITDKLIERAKQDVAKLDIIIAAYG
jgi:hypothetical protein